MSLISFMDWIAKESSAATRSKTAAALGLGPDVASVFGHSTPSPWVAKTLQDKLKKNSVKQVDLPGENPPKPIWSLPERVQNPDYSFDKWIKDVVKKSSELEDVKKSVEDDNEQLDKEIADRLKKDDQEDKEDKEDKEEKKDDHLKKDDQNKQFKEKKGEEVKSKKPQKNSQEENGGKESKWVSQKKEMEKVGRHESQKDS